jgi:hypothetical protein
MNTMRRFIFSAPPNDIEFSGGSHFAYEESSLSLNLSNVFPGFLVGLYFLAVLAATVYFFICLARITAALQGIAASLRRIEMRVSPPSPEDLSRGIDV